MMNMDEIQATTIQLNNLYRLSSVHVEEFLKTLFQHTLRMSSVIGFKSDGSHAYFRIGNVYVSTRLSF